MLPQQLQAPYSFLQLPIQDQSQPSDPNSPEIFRQNLHVVHSQVLRVQAIARDILAGIHNAYQVGASPTQTEGDIATLKQHLHMLNDLLGQTGVGSLPLLSASGGALTADAIMNEHLNLDAITRDTAALFERLARSQESAATVANLLGAQGGAPALGPSIGR